MSAAASCGDITESYEETQTNITTAVMTEATETDAMDIYPKLYKREVSRIFAHTSAANHGSSDVSYALCDLDSNGIPELILKHGTGEADYVISVYTVDDNAKLIRMDDLAGGHTAFGCSEYDSSLVLIYGHMGNGAISWYSLKDGALSETKSESFYLAYNEGYDDYMNKYGVKYIGFVNAFNLGYEDTETKSFLYCSDGTKEEFSGLYLDYIK